MHTSCSIQCLTKNCSIKLPYVCQVNSALSFMSQHVPMELFKIPTTRFKLSCILDQVLSCISYFGHKEVVSIVHVPTHILLVCVSLLGVIMHLRFWFYTFYKIIKLCLDCTTSKQAHYLAPKLLTHPSFRILKLVYVPKIL